MIIFLLFSQASSVDSDSAGDFSCPFHSWKWENQTKHTHSLSLTEIEKRGLFLFLFCQKQGLGLRELDKSSQKVQIYSCKINKFWGCNV